MNNKIITIITLLSLVMFISGVLAEKLPSPPPSPTLNTNSGANSSINNSNDNVNSQKSNFPRGLLIILGIIILLIIVFLLVTPKNSRNKNIKSPKSIK